MWGSRWRGRRGLGPISGVSVFPCAGGLYLRTARCRLFPFSLGQWLLMSRVSSGEVFDSDGSVGGRFSITGGSGRDMSAGIGGSSIGIAKGGSGIEMDRPCSSTGISIGIGGSKVASGMVVVVVVSMALRLLLDGDIPGFLWWWQPGGPSCSSLGLLKGSHGWTVCVGATGWSSAPKLTWSFSSFSLSWTWKS